MARKFEIGTIVRHKARYLRSVGWVTDVPRNGVVVGYSTLGDDYPIVRWCNRDADQPIRVENVEKTRSKVTAATMRARLGLTAEGVIDG